jgi:plasmid stabilization system protein ParE
MKLKFHPDARSDLREAREFYRRRSPLAAVSFVHDVDAALRDIVEAPERYPEAEHGTRQLVFPRRFPYTIVYRIHRGGIIIVAVAHHGRAPGYWRHRT